MAHAIVEKDTYGQTIEIQAVRYDPVLKKEVTVPVNAFTTREFRITKPGGGSPITLAAGFITDGTDGWLTAFVSSALSLWDQLGNYKLDMKLQNATQLFESADEITIQVK